MKITKNELTLRRFQCSDREVLVSLANNPEVSKYLAPHFPYPYTAADAETWLDFTQAEKQPLNMAIEWQGQLAGGIGLTLLSGLFIGTAELGYWLGQPYWGKGIARRAIQLFMPYVFNELAFTRVQAIVFAENYKSARVLEQSGFVKEATLRSHISKNGTITDAVIYAQLKTDLQL